MSRGVFILFEGVDHSGKTTQAKMLIESLNENGVPCKLLRFPDRTTATGKMINEYLAGKNDSNMRVMHLLFAANRWEAAKEIVRLLKEGVNLVVDRYSFSGIAFAAAQGIDFEFCKQTEVGLPCPDAIIYLDIDPKEASKRSGYGTERFETVDFQDNVRMQFKALQSRYWNVLDARQSEKELAEKVKVIFGLTVSQSASTPVRFIQ